MIADKVQAKRPFFRSDHPLSWAGVLILTDTWAFYTGLGLVIAGVGLLKPNISTMVGGLSAR
jgi:POT family proton-dependent oligopeptide transporter